MTKKLRSAWLAVAAAILSLVPLSGRQAPVNQQQPQVFRGVVRVVPVDVRVVDAQGRPVTDLTAADFVVLENGVRQPITQFLPHTLEPDPALASTPRALRTDNPSPGPPRAADRRVFLIVLGRGRLQVPLKGVDGLIHFVHDRLLPQDVVAVMAYDRATDFTTDHAEIVELLERFKKTHEKIDAQLKTAFAGLRVIYGSRDLPPSIRTEVDAIFAGLRSGAGKTLPPVPITDAARVGRDTTDTIDRLQGTNAVATDTTLDAFLSTHAQSMQDAGNLYTGIEYLRYIDGEKHLIFMSETGVMLPRGDDDRNLARRASDARVAIDYFQTGGTPTGSSISSGMTAEARRGPVRAGGPAPPPAMAVSSAVIQVARELATTSGGRLYVSQFPSASKALDDLDLTTRTGYLLGYTPADQRLDSRYRNIIVRVTRPGVTVQYRRGYLANPDPVFFDTGVMQTYSRVTTAASYGGDVRDIGVHVTAESNPPNHIGPIRVHAQVDVSRVKFTKDGLRNTASLEVATFAANSKGAVVGYSWQTLALTFTDDRLQAVLRDGVPYDVVVDASTQARDVKVVVYDPADDLTGSFMVRLK